MDSTGMIYRRNGKKVYIKQPEFEELSFVSKLWADEDTMKDIGGTYDFSENKWEMFYNKMVYPGDGKNFYCLVYDAETDEPVGEVSFHGYDCIIKSARFNVKIIYSQRRKGYGEEAIKLLLEYYFFEFGGKMIIDNIKTNEVLNLVEKFGFCINGQFKDDIVVRLNKEDFLNYNVITKRKVGILMYDNMDLFSYSMSNEILSMVNKISSKEIFEITPISFQEVYKVDSKYEIHTEYTKEKYDILIIPNGIVDVNEEVINYLKDNFKYSDYICIQGQAVNFLGKCDMLEGIFIPKQLIKENTMDIPDRRIIDKQFIDNGKILISSNIIGHIESLLRLIEKIAGKKVSIRVAKEIGIKYE